MTPKTLAAIGLRIIGLWLVVEAVIGVLSLFLINSDLVAGMPGVHRRLYVPDVTSSFSELYLHDSYYVILHLASSVAVPGFRFIAGLVLIFASKPVGRIVSHKLDSP